MCRSKTAGPRWGVRQRKQNTGTGWPQLFHPKAHVGPAGLLCPGPGFGLPTLGTVVQVEWPESDAAVLLALLECVGNFSVLSASLRNHFLERAPEEPHKGCPWM
jgi:hypothetical protein